MDLENYEIPHDRTVTRIKVAEPKVPEDAERICKYMETGDILIVDMSCFTGTPDERQTMSEILHTKARFENYSMVSSGQMYIITPSDISVKKI